MDPKMRILKQITIDDAKEADRLFDILMGEERMPRKKFIQVYAKKVKNLDVQKIDNVKRPGLYKPQVVLNFVFCTNRQRR